MEKAIDNVISDSLEVEGEYMEDGLTAPDGDEMGLTKLRGFKCPIKACSMKTERLAGILRHLFTRHGYEGKLILTKVYYLDELIHGFNEPFLFKRL